MGNFACIELISLTKRKIYPLPDSLEKRHTITLALFILPMNNAINFHLMGPFDPETSRFVTRHLLCADPTIGIEEQTIAAEGFTDQFVAQVCQLILMSGSRVIIIIFF